MNTTQSVNTMKYFSAFKKKIGNVDACTTWLHVEDIKLSEISQ
jgi:hypothetical protein